MADIDSKIEIPLAGSAFKITTGPIRGSQKIHVAAPGNPKVKVAMRQINLEPSCGEAPVNVYDASGPYTDPDVLIDISAGLAELRRPWQLARGDVEVVTQREVQPEDNGHLGPDRSGGVPAFPNVRKQVFRAKPGMNLSQMHYARHDQQQECVDQQTRNRHDHQRQHGADSSNPLDRCLQPFAQCQHAILRFYRRLA